jgi:hypothetical protein
LNITVGGTSEAGSTVEVLLVGRSIGTAQASAEGTTFSNYIIIPAAMIEDLS